MHSLARDLISDISLPTLFTVNQKKPSPKRIKPEHKLPRLQLQKATAATTQMVKLARWKRRRAVILDLPLVLLQFWFMGLYIFLKIPLDAVNGWVTSNNSVLFLIWPHFCFNSDSSISLSREGWASFFFLIKLLYILMWPLCVTSKLKKFT